MFFVADPDQRLPYRGRGGRGGSLTPTTKYHIAVFSTDTTIMSFLVNVANAVIISSLTLFKHSAYPHDHNHNTNAIKYHLQMHFPRVWGKYGFTDSPKITIPNHWEHKHTVFIISAFHHFVSSQSPVNLRANALCFPFVKGKCWGSIFSLFPWLHSYYHLSKS